MGTYSALNGQITKSSTAAKLHRAKYGTRNPPVHFDRHQYAIRIAKTTK